MESLGCHAGRKHSDSETTGEMVDLQIRKIKKKLKDGTLKRKKNEYNVQGKRSIRNLASDVIGRGKQE